MMKISPQIETHAIDFNCYVRTFQYVHALLFNTTDS